MCAWLAGCAVEQRHNTRTTQQWGLRARAGASPSQLACVCHPLLTAAALLASSVMQDGMREMRRLGLRPNRETYLVVLRSCEGEAAGWLVGGAGDGCWWGSIWERIRFCANTAHASVAAKHSKQTIRSLSPSRPAPPRCLFSQPRPTRRQRKRCSMRCRRRASRRRGRCTRRCCVSTLQLGTCRCGVVEWQEVPGSRC